VYTSYYVWICGGSFVVGLFSYLVGRWSGVRIGRKEVIHTFDQILIRMYHLVHSGNSEALHEFMDQVCSKEVSSKIDSRLLRDDKEKEGYT